MPLSGTRLQSPRADQLGTAAVPDEALGANTASLGLCSGHDDAALAPFTFGALVGQHGCWKRRPQIGRKVIFVPFADSGPARPRWIC